MNPIVVARKTAQAACDKLNFESFLVERACS